jgi:hypothetical protein
MSINDLYRMYQVTLGTTQLGAITQVALPLNTQVGGEPTSGSLYTYWQGVVSQKPQCDFTTKAIAAALGICGMTGYNIGATSSAMVVYAAKRQKGGTIAAGASHRKYTFNAGILVPRTLTVNHGEDATLSYQAVLAYDGTNAIILPVDAQALPAAEADAERFGLGPITIESILLKSVESLSIEFGITAEAEAAGGDIWPDYPGIKAILPVLTLRGMDPTWLASATVETIPLGGTLVTHAATNIYLRKRLLGGTYVADGTAEHIKLSAAGLATITNALNVDGTENGKCDLTMPMRFDGTNLPLLIDTTSAIA